MEDQLELLEKEKLSIEDKLLDHYHQIEYYENLIDALEYRLEMIRDEIRCLNEK